MSIEVIKLIEKLKWNYYDIGLYEQALTHSSYAHENNNEFGHNERLEFLGDAVLELIISDYLFKIYPELSEGNLTKLRADLVCENSLAQLATWIGVGDFLLLGRGEKAHGGAERPSILADAVEALIGALYVDTGYFRSYYHVINLFEPVFIFLKDGLLRLDYKTLVQEYYQAKRGITPVYVIVDDSGPDHDKLFISELMIGKTIVGKGEGKSKKEAEQNAAKTAWEIINQNNKQ